jgi:hypothetical protein
VEGPDWKEDVIAGNLTNTNKGRRDQRWSRSPG